LLRVLQEQEFERVGGSDTIHVDVRVIAASNQDIEKSVREGKFREDLYYRLNVVRVEIPPLRERQGDIPLLVQAFLKEFCEVNAKPLLKISQKALDGLVRYLWPGNVRQLRNVIEGMVVLSTGHELTPRNLPEEILSASKQPTVQIKIGATLEDMEREMIRATLTQTGGNRAATARLLGVGRKTLYRKLEEYGLESSAEAE
jgi:DNA-binding NtrC family response regulator